MTAHAHQYTTNGDRYRCPVRNCRWTATGVQALPEPPTPARIDPRLRMAMRAESPVCRFCGCGIVRIGGDWANSGGMYGCISRGPTGGGAGLGLGPHEPMPEGLRGAAS